MLIVLPMTLMLALLTVSYSVAQSGQRGVSVAARAQAAGKARRVALIIGNGSYEFGPLKNPPNDARDMAQALRGLGFEVLYSENLSQNEMKRAIRAFGERSRGAGVRLFYYAGHGVQLNGENYLIPVDAKLTDEREVEYEGVNVGLVLSQMEGAEDSINIVILDACRNNPFPRSSRSAARGLAAINAPSGTLIAYSTAPGSVASDGDDRNGLYTQELLRFIRTPGLNVEDVFKRVRLSLRNRTQGKQTPWESSSLTGDFYFVGGGSIVSGGNVQPTPADPSALELSFWNEVKDSKDPEDLKAYLERYPDGAFAPLARRRLQSLQRSGAADGSGSSGLGNSPGVRSRGQIARAKFFTFNLQQCRTSGSTVTCELLITNDESTDRPLSFYHLDYGLTSGLVDDQGTQVRMTDNRIANVLSYDRALLVSGVATHARATFDGISPDAKTIKLLVLAFSTVAQGYIEDSFKVEYRNVPLSQ